MVRDVRELRTFALVVICYLLWMFFLWKIHVLHPVISILALSLIIAFHSSLQHEILHGHPFDAQWLNEALVFPAIGVFVPFIRFRDTHLAHHQDAILTDPYDDPETNYLDPEIWEGFGGAIRAVLQFNNTLLGRMLIGPFIGLWVFYRGDLRAMKRGDRAVGRAWIWHILGLLPVLAVLWVWSVPILFYLMATLGGLSLLKIRTFLEHRAFEQSAGRSVIIESRGPLAFLFLNNNFHSVHHAHPDLAWYDLPAKYSTNRENYLKRNRDYRFGNYGEIFRAYFLKRKDEVAHPLYPWGSKKEREK